MIAALSLLPTLKLIRLIALGVPLWLIALLLPAGWLAGLAYLVLLTALCWRDVNTIPGASELSARRELPPRFALGVDQSLTLVLLNRTALALLAWVRDEVPESFESRDELPPVHLPPHGEARLNYTVRPLKRGAHSFGDTPGENRSTGRKRAQAAPLQSRRHRLRESPPLHRRRRPAQHRLEGDGAPWRSDQPK
jgi:uncharacterized protein (DUF58 family)